MKNSLTEGLRDRSFHISFFPKPKVVEVHITGAPGFLHPVRAIFISDIHLRRIVNNERLESFIQLIKDQNADLLLLGGDYGEGRDQCVRFFRALSDIHFPLGAFGVPGNNDHFEDLSEIAELGNVRILKNTSSEIVLPGGMLRISGSDENKYGNPDTRSLFPDPDCYRILLSHFPTMPECECDLQLSGHTHGGQIDLFGISAYSFGFERKYRIQSIRGLSVSASHLLFVGNGIGISKFPIRFGAESEFYVLRFQK